MKRSAWVAAVGLVVLVAAVWFLSGSTREGVSTDRTTREVALACTTDMATEFHIHPTLAIYINGEQQVIPADIGVRPTCMTALHTHTSDGILHVESPERRDFTLADFFAVWEQPFSRDEVLGYRADAQHRIRMTVNGEPVETYEDTVLYDHDQIVIYYESL